MKKLHERVDLSFSNLHEEVIGLGAWIMIDFRTSKSTTTGKRFAGPQIYNHTSCLAPYLGGGNTFEPRHALVKRQIDNQDHTWTATTQ
jgi:hypothetical protein